MMDVVDYHMDVRSTKEDIETEDNSDSGLEECGTSPISNTSTNRSISSPISSSYESDHIKTNIPFRPQIITPSEGSAFSKIEKLITHSPQPAAFPPVNFGVPSSVGYIPGFFVPPWAAAGFNHQNYLASLSKKPATTSDSESEDQPEKEQNKNVFNEVDTSIPFTNYFQNLTKLLQKTQANGVKLEESEESENEPGEITKRNRPELTNLYRNGYQSTEHQSLQHMDDNGTNRRVGMNPGVFPNGHALSMAQLIGPHPYFSTTPSQLPQFSPNSQMYQYFGGIQPPTGLLHPALLHMAGLRSRRINTEKPPPIKKYKCDVCGKAFSRSNTLVTHKRIHTGDKPFKCEVCGRAFRQPGNLTRHRLTHTTVKPYVCPSCNKAFNRASNLHTHMRTHTNFKPFTCPYCGKGFHQKIDMKIHCYTHTGERPHRCDICGKGFTLISTLNAHRRIHTESVAEPEMA